MRSVCVALLLCLSNTVWSAPTAGHDTLANDIKNKTAFEIAEKYPAFPLLKEVKLGDLESTEVKPLPLVVGFKPPLNIPQARKMIVEWVAMYQKNLNDSVSLSSYLTHFPVEANSIEIVGVFFDPKVHVPSSDVLWSFALLDGVIQYYTFDRNVGKRTVQQETIQEAYQLIGRPLPESVPKVWNPLPGSQYALTVQELQKQLVAQANDAKKRGQPNLQLCADDASFMPAIVLARMDAKERELLKVLSFTPMPFVSATVCKWVNNSLVGVQGYVPLLDTELAIKYIKEGISLDAESLLITTLQWAVESPIYVSMLKAELSKQEDGAKK